MALDWFRQATYAPPGQHAESGGQGPKDAAERSASGGERLEGGDQALSLRPKTFALLRYLVEHLAQLLTKAALLEALWPEVTVSEVVLFVCIRELRQALVDVAKTPRFIEETAHRRGYRFIGSLPTVRLSTPLTSVPFPPPARRARANGTRCIEVSPQH